MRKWRRWVRWQRSKHDRKSGAVQERCSDQATRVLPTATLLEDILEKKAVARGHTAWRWLDSLLTFVVRATWDPTIRGISHPHYTALSLSKLKRSKQKRKKSKKLDWTSGSYLGRRIFSLVGLGVCKVDACTVPWDPTLCGDHLIDAKVQTKLEIFVEKKDATGSL